MTATLGRLIAFAGVPARRVAASAVLAMLAVGFGIALIAVWDIVDAFLKARRAR